MIKKGLKVEGRDALSIVVLALLIIIIRTLFAPAPVVLPSPYDFAPEQRTWETNNSGYRTEPERSYSGTPRSTPTRTSNATSRSSELFDFDPNTLDSAGFLRLGFSSGQTNALLRYRASGAQFRKPEDFSRSFVVSEQMYLRLAPHIRIAQMTPLQTETVQLGQQPPVGRFQLEIIEMNGADTSQLIKLRGIGPYYAQKIVLYRERLGGFVAVEQIMEVEGIDEERFTRFALQLDIDLGLVRKIDLKTADQSTLGKHPYIGPYAARWIVHYREQLGDSVCTPQSLLRRNIIKPKEAEWLAYYVE
jgi:competence ComEA-like helix-hairpin-helix protein